VSEEELNELKTSTLRNYVNKASIDAVGRGVDAGIKGMTGPKKEMEKNMSKAYKRQRGINRAANKLASRAERREEVELDERLGGKGYKRRKDYAGRTVEGDWEDSDRGAGNKATRRAGGKVKKKSPTYQAYVLNKEGLAMEAKVDAGLSPEEKEKVRNVRKFGVSHNVAGHGKLRRSLAKMHRGDKKIPGDKSKWMEMESVELGDANGNLAFEVVDIIKAPPMKTVLPAAQFELVDENYEKIKTGEVLSAFKRDPKVRKRFEKAARKDRGPGSVENQAADDMLQTAKDIAKRKGDTSKSDDRYAYEQVEVKKNSEIVQELFGNKKYPYGKATKKNPRGKRDQAELDRAQEYIKKNPNFGKVIESKDAAFDYVVNKYRKKYGKDAVITKDSPKPKPPSDAEKAKAAAERKKRQDADNKAYAARAKKAGFKSTQDYTDVVARYGSEDNYNKGRGLGT